MNNCNKINVAEGPRKDWNAELYLRFERERTQPALDLVGRLRDARPRTVLDVGCGPGNSTAVLRAAFPETALTGIDSSPTMIEKAKSRNLPGATFVLRNATEIEGRYDIVFSNACLQWIPDHRKLLPFLASRLNDGGVLAVQVPNNGEEPLFRIIDDVAKSGPWRFPESVFSENRVLTPREYFDVLSSFSATFDVWETTYCHALPDHAALLEWVKSTGLRPFLAALDEAECDGFVAEILRRAKEAYEPTENGSVLLRFRRLFFTAVVT